MYEVGSVSKESGAICMGLMHSTPQRQQEQHNMVVKAMSQPFVHVLQWQTTSSKHVQQITQLHGYAGLCDC